MTDNHRNSSTKATEGWTVYGPRWSAEYGWSWAVRTPAGAWMGATHRSTKSTCERAIAAVLPQGEPE